MIEQEQQQDSVERLVKFRKALKAMFESPNGQEVAKFLTEAYVDTPAVHERPEITYYKLGQKEFVQGLLKDATAELQEFSVTTDRGE